jgi:hypothetical protein
VNLSFRGAADRECGQGGERNRVGRVKDHPILESPQPRGGTTNIRRAPSGRRQALPRRRPDTKDRHQRCEKRQAAPGGTLRYRPGANGSASRSSSMVQSLGSVSPIRTDFTWPSM